MPGGRPKKELDQKQFENLCGLQCTEKEICCFFDVCDETLTRWCKDTYGMGFSDTYELKRGAGKISLRRSQFKLAEKSAAMAIFLGQQYLGQRNYAAIQDDPKSTENPDNGLKDALLSATKEAWSDENSDECDSSI